VRSGDSAHGGFRREGDVASGFSQGCRWWSPKGLQVLEAAMVGAQGRRRLNYGGRT